MKPRSFNNRFYMKCGCEDCAELNNTKRRYGKSIRSVKQDEAAKKVELKYAKEF